MAGTMEKQQDMTRYICFCYFDLEQEENDEKRITKAVKYLVDVTQLCLITQWVFFSKYNRLDFSLLTIKMLYITRSVWQS